jgi:hypothetical protein
MLLVDVIPDSRSSRMGVFDIHKKGVSEDDNILTEQCRSMTPNMSEYQPFRISTLVTSFFKVLSLPGLVLIYVTYYTDITVFFTDVLPTAFGNFFGKIDVAIDAKGINLTTLLLSLLVLIPRIILGLIVFALWMVIGELNRHYILPIILAGLVLGINRSRKAIMREVFTLRFCIRSLFSLTINMFITRIFPFVSEKCKLLIDLLSDLVVTGMEKTISFIRKKLSKKR